MKLMERSHERESFLLARKLPQDDIMEEKIPWRGLALIDLPPSLVEYGKNSREKEVQYAREKVILQAIYFNRAMIPDTASEPDLEVHATTDPVTIPLDDATGNPDSVNDFTGTPWPDSKPMLIPHSPPPQFHAPLPGPVHTPQMVPLQHPQQPPPPELSPQHHPQFASFTLQQFPGPPQMYPGQPPMGPGPGMPPPGMMPSNMGPGPMPLMGPNIMPTGGDWRTGDGKVIPMTEIPVDMYNQGNPPMGPMGPMGPMPGPPDMNFNMMGPGGEMGPYPTQNPYAPMGPNMFPAYRGGGGG
ncbi:unnamed protein product, partial [Timema podura]|nr:unnamed protein product [Timema podura]